MTKIDREWFRGASHGYDAAREAIEKYGYGHARLQADQLAADVRRRSETHTNFDRGYSAAFKEIAYGLGEWFPEGTKGKAL